MDARSADLGLEIGSIASRWISNLAKDEPIKAGLYTVLTGSMLYTCVTQEDVYGYTGTTVTPIMVTDLEISSDEAGIAGVQVGE